MQLIKSVLPFCSALPIQYTPNIAVASLFIAGTGPVGLGHRSLRCVVGTSTTQQFDFVVLLT